MEYANAYDLTAAQLAVSLQAVKPQLDSDELEALDSLWRAPRHSLWIARRHDSSRLTQCIRSISEKMTRNLGAAPDRDNVSWLGFRVEEDDGWHWQLRDNFAEALSIVGWGEIFVPQGAPLAPSTASFELDKEWEEGSPKLRAHLRRERAPGLSSVVFDS